MVTETTNNNGSSTTAKTGLGLAIGALGVQLLSGTFGNVLGGPRPPAGDPPWARDLSYERQLTIANAEIGQLKAEKYADAGTLAAERRLADKIEKIETTMQAAFRAQGEYNVANTAAVASIGNQTAQLMKMTGLVINSQTMLSSEGFFNQTLPSVSPSAIQ